LLIKYEVGWTAERSDRYGEYDTFLCDDGFMDFIHHPKNKILKIFKKIKITTFRKLALLPFSGEWRGRREEHLLCWVR
jgi:hypothetical protein